MARQPTRLDRYNMEKAADLGTRGEPSKHALKTGRIAVDRVAVPDPDPNPDAGPGQRVVATVNRRVDILEHERAHGRISNDAYLEGRVLQALFERAGLSGGSTWSDGSRVDAEVAKELAVLRKVSNGRAFDHKMRELRSVLGERDALIVREVLAENRSYAQVTATLNVKLGAIAQTHYVPLGKGGVMRVPRVPANERRIAYIANRFRDALETLALEQRRR